MTYTIEADLYIDSEGEICTIRDAFMQKSFREDVRFLSGNISEYLGDDEGDDEQCISLTDRSTDGSTDEKKRYEELCRIINKKIDVRPGWNPLHYVCRFHPKEVELIKLLVDKNPESVLQVNMPSTSSWRIRNR